MSSSLYPPGTLVQIASYNTNLQGVLGVPQDLVDWLSPTLTVSKFLARTQTAPDIVAVGFQELLPLHLGFSGLSKSVIENRNKLIQSQIEAHAPNNESYFLVAKEVFVGVALLVYARDVSVGRRVCDVQTTWTGCGPAWLGNKGAVGVRFRVTGQSGDVGEVFTFVNAHLTAHDHLLPHRIADWNHIVRTLLFPAPNPALGPAITTIYATSHLFVFGDLNFRLDIPRTHPLLSDSTTYDQFHAHLDTDRGREELKEFDQLLTEWRKGTVFPGLREAEFWRFKCTYKFFVGEVNQYNMKRIPSWTDRILYTTYTDPPDSSAVKPVLYTSIPSYTTSDHKPIVALLLLPPATTSSPPAPIPMLPHPPQYAPAPFANLKRHTGRILGRVLGIFWYAFWMLGLGNAIFGLVNALFGLGAMVWWRSNTESV